MIAAVTIAIAVVIAALLGRFALGESGIIEHERDYDGPIEDWDGTWGRDEE